MRTYKWSGVSIDGLDNLQRWMDVMRDQPGMSAGIEVPFSLGNVLEDKGDTDKFAKEAQKTLQT